MKGEYCMGCGMLVVVDSSEHKKVMMTKGLE